MLPPNSYNNDIKKTELSDQFDIKKALRNIPKSERHKATKLLKEIELRSAEITFDSQGVIYIEGESIEGSNFFKFLPLLYKKRKPKKIQGFDEFLQKLLNMGLQNLFLLKQKQNPVISMPKNVETSNNDFWWVLN